MDMVWIMIPEVVGACPKRVVLDGLCHRILGHEKGGHLLALMSPGWAWDMKRVVTIRKRSAMVWILTGVGMVNLDHARSVSLNGLGHGKAVDMVGSGHSLG